MTTYLEELKWRGLLHQTAGEGLEDYLNTPGTPGTPESPVRIAYAGFDPTADSLTIGNFIPIIALMHWQRCGHKPIIVMGGGTGMIGDPSGKEEERQLRTRDEIDANVNAQKKIFERLLNFDDSKGNGAVVVNNMDWLDKLSYIDMLRDVGKHFSVNMMIHKESIKNRLENREQGISYTEFSYMILQAYDFLHLYNDMKCEVQLGGSDQYGNIVAGIDLIRRAHGGEDSEYHAYGVTMPLVTKADGSKIGKTESGAIWLTADRTSPYQFYQYWINTDDADVVQFLNWFTLFNKEEIGTLSAKHAEAPHQREAHRSLAQHMTALLHGEDEMKRVEAASGALFSGKVGNLDEAMLIEVFADVPHSTHDKSQLEGDGIALSELLVETTLASSKRESREFLGNGAVSINGVKVDAERCLKASDLLHGKTILIRRGKKKWHATQWS